MQLSLSVGACPVGLSCFLSAAAVAAAGGGTATMLALHGSAVAGVCVSRSAAVAASDEWVAHDAFSEARGVAAQPPPQTCSVTRCGPGARPLLCAAGLTCVAPTAASSAASSSSSSYGSGYGSCVLLAAGEATTAGAAVLSEYTDTAGVVCTPAVCVRSVGGACGVTGGGACGADLLCTPVTAGHWEGPARCLDARAAPGAAARHLMAAAAIAVFSNRGESDDDDDDVCSGDTSTTITSDYSLGLRGTLSGAARVTAAGRACQILPPRHPMHSNPALLRSMASHDVASISGRPSAAAAATRLPPSTGHSWWMPRRAPPSYPPRAPPPSRSWASPRR